MKYKVDQVLQELEHNTLGHDESNISLTNPHATVVHYMYFTCRFYHCRIVYATNGLDLMRQLVFERFWKSCLILWVCMRFHLHCFRTVPILFDTRKAPWLLVYHGYWYHGYWGICFEGSIHLHFRYVHFHLNFWHNHDNGVQNPRFHVFDVASP